MHIKPLGKRVVLEKIETENITQSGIILTEKNNEEDQFGIVIAIGEKVEQEDIIIGKKLIYKKYSETIIKFKDKELLVVDEEDLLGIIENGDK